ncbi:FAD-dependent oxidoreductase [Curtobacterium aurantiacum]|uniref:FAD-dependent oxidoreductase n=1 Tax=Curtobacterium aurantiacum TaxID=3236919 RepID=UPI001BE09625|nr:FAD-dependent oxidoreductase [Curtobacterium flaccumfaciens]MBT1675689.1 FAD-dependent monooxygenase [Curtobacterium flaccumfaciens pv. flaccumfaciens]
MTRNTVRPVDVLVVGAGPTGLAAAIELRRRGCQVLIVDAGAEGSNTSRAALIHARTLEVLEPIGVTPKLLAEGVVVPRFSLQERARVLARLDFSHLPTEYPFTLMLPQYRTEQLLTQHLTELGVVVHRQVRLTRLQQGDGFAEAGLTDARGVATSVTARFVVGADGLRSTVRARAGIAFDGSSSTQQFVLADVRMDWPLLNDEVQLFFSPSGLVVVAPLPHGQHRVVATVGTAEKRPGLPEVQALLDARGPGATRLRELVWSSRFQVQHRVAARYRWGTAFLAGDAAHVHSPAGGQGMNTGIQDAVDLATTIAEVLGGADPATLDGYEQRRRPVAQEVVRFTDRMTRVANLRSPVARRVRNTLLSTVLRTPSVQLRVAQRLAELR